MRVNVNLEILYNDTSKLFFWYRKVGLVVVATFTRVNGTVSRFCNKRLQNLHTVYTNFSM